MEEDMRSKDGPSVGGGRLARCVKGVATLALAALSVATLALAARAEAPIHWGSADGIGDSNLVGSEDG
jgi:hypothetical protein